ncbi:MAG: response regulator [Spirochaetales bacterium]|nr:response regulator [Spirochaetales bacterium]
MSKRVIVVDDSDASRDSLSFALQQKGYEVIQAEDGVAALAALNKGKNIDLVITDLNMPRMNGLEFVKTLRGKEEFRFTPIIVLSSEKEEIKKSREAGASAWIAKSSKMSDELMAAIKKLIPQ